MIIIYILFGTAVTAGIIYHFHNECMTHNYQPIREVELEEMNKLTNQNVIIDDDGNIYTASSLLMSNHKKDDDWEFIEKE